MEETTASISNTISKGFVDEEISLSWQGSGEAAGRSSDDVVPETFSNEVIRKGNEILKTYEVCSEAICGGMGSVWRVHHKGWNVDLAMKRPQPRFFSEGGERRKKEFVSECENWINLGLHPGIVSCYYVREIGGIPTIFSEWMEGGSLKNRIDDGTLYEGLKDEVEARILDIAIQFAEGLHYAHESEGHLIHQDVKPDNLLLTGSWEAKVADFGLAKARRQLLDNPEDAAGQKPEKTSGLPADATHVAPTGGYTPAYCSGEQLRGEKLTRRTDIYSWAASVLEMYLGSRPWKNGSEARRVFAGYSGKLRVRIPDLLEDLLMSCLADNPDDRPHDFAVIMEDLKRIYLETCGEEYPHKVSEAAADTADSLNNRALSFLDLNKPEEAERLWKKALNDNRGHPQSVYNYGVYRWMHGKEDRLSLRQELLALNDSSVRTGLLRQLDEVAPNSIPVFQRTIFSGNGFSQTVYDVRSEKFYIVSTIDGGGQHSWYLRCRESDGSIGNMIPADGCTRLSVSADGKGLCFRSDDAGSRTKLFDLEKQTFISTIVDKRRKINTGCAGMNAAGWYLAEKDKLFYQDTAAGTESVVRRDFPNSVGLYLSPGGQYLACSRNMGGHYLFSLLDLENGREVISRRSERTLRACFSPDGNTVYVGFLSGDIAVFECATGKVTAEFHTKEEITTICADESGRFLLTSHYVKDKGLIRLWDIPDNSCRMTIDTEPHAKVCFSRSPSGELRAAAFCGMTGIYYEWDIFQQNVLPVWSLSQVARTDAQLEREQRFIEAIKKGNAALEAGRKEEAVSLLHEASEIGGFEADARRVDLYRRIVSNMRKGRIRNTVLLSSISAEQGILSPDGKYLLDEEKEIVYASDSGEAVLRIGTRERRSSLCLTEQGLIRMYVSGGKDDLMMERYTLPDGNKCYRNCIRKHPGASGVVPSMTTSTGCKTILINSPGFWRVHDLSVDIASGHVIEDGIVPGPLWERRLIADDRVISSKGIFAHKKNLLGWKIPEDISCMMDSALCRFLIVYDKNEDLAGVMIRSVFAKKLTDRAGDISRQAKSVLERRMMIFRMDSGDLLFSGILPEGTYSDLSAGMLARYQEEGIELCGLADILRQGGWVSVETIPHLSTGMASFSDDLLIMSMAFEHKVNVYLLEWELLPDPKQGSEA